MFFGFTQNNSGGWFEVDDSAGIGPEVWIESNNLDHAIRRALEIGLYFDGLQTGRDCSCCGARWSKPWEEDESEDLPHIDPKYDFNWHDTDYIHTLDGTIKRIKKRRYRTEAN